MLTEMAGKRAESREGGAETVNAISDGGAAAGQSRRELLTIEGT